MASHATIAEEMFLFSIPLDDLTDDQIDRINFPTQEIIGEMFVGGMAGWPGLESVQQ